VDLSDLDGIGDRKTIEIPEDLVPAPFDGMGASDEPERRTFGGAIEEAEGAIGGLSEPDGEDFHERSPLIGLWLVGFLALVLHYTIDLCQIVSHGSEKDSRDLQPLDLKKKSSAL